VNSGVGVISARTDSFRGKRLLSLQAHAARMSSLDTSTNPLEVSQRIRVIRGQRVLLDSDVAQLCGVPATRLPQDFVLRLKNQALASPRSQSAIINTGRGQHRGTASLLSVTPIIAILTFMKRVTALEAKTRFGEVLEAAQRQPVSITRNGRPSVVMISAESYERRQRMARERLRQSLQRAGEHAATQGMNEDVLDQLLADES
jgi:prevent-host-death family protein